MKYSIECAQSYSCDEATEQDVRWAMEHDSERGEFIIVTASDGSFMQAAGEGSGEYQLEFHDAAGESPLHVEQPVTKSQVTEALVSFVREDDQWKQQHNWTKLDLKSGCTGAILFALLAPSVWYFTMA